MKKVLIVSDYKENIGGIETYIYNLKKILENEGYEVKIFGGEKINKIKKIIFLFISLYNIFYSKNLKKEINKFKPDIIWFHSISRLLGPKIIDNVENFNGLKIMTYHDLGYFSLFASEIKSIEQIPQKFSFIEFIKKSKKGKIYILYSIFKYIKLNILRKKLYKNIDIHTCPSSFMKEFIINQKWGKKVEILPNFVLKEQVQERKNIYQDKINLIFFGRLEKEKGFTLILGFLAKLQELKFFDKKKYKKITENIRIFIFGDGKEKKLLFDTFTGRDINGNDIGIVNNFSDTEKISNINEIIDTNNKFVYYFGKRSYNDILNYISFSHYHLVPSLFLETFGLSAAEAAANGVVNIGFDKLNINSFILDKYKIENTETFSDKVIEIVEKHNINEWSKDSNESKNLVKNIIV